MVSPKVAYIYIYYRLRETAQPSSLGLVGFQRRSQEAPIQSLEFLGIPRTFLEFLDLYKAFYEETWVLGGPRRC